MYIISSYIFLYFLNLAVMGLTIHCSSRFQRFRRWVDICLKKKSLLSYFFIQQKKRKEKKRKIMMKAWCYEKRPSKLLYTSMANLKNSDHAIFYTVQSILLSKSCCPRRRRPEYISASMWRWGEARRRGGR